MKRQDLNRRYMEASVNRGTGGGAYMPGYRVGGKTGTAQKAEKDGYGNRHISSFLHFFQQISLNTLY